MVFGERTDGMNEGTYCGFPMCLEPPAGNDQLLIYSCSDKRY
jgi:hypothetical protein